MKKFDELCKMAEEIPAEAYPEVLRTTAAKVLPALEEAAGSAERADTIFAAFLIASVYADGTLDEAEYLLLLPGLAMTFGEAYSFEEVKEYIEQSKKEGKQIGEFADALCDFFGELSDDLKDDLVILSLLICAADGKITNKEKKYIKKLIR